MPRSKLLKKLLQLGVQEIIWTRTTPLNALKHQDHTPKCIEAIAM